MAMSGAKTLAERSSSGKAPGKAGFGAHVSVLQGMNPTTRASIGLSAAVVISVLILGCASSAGNRTGGGLFGHGVTQKVVDASQVKIPKDERFASSEFEDRLIASSFSQLNERGAQILDCSYPEDGYKSHFFFWYRTVVYPQSGFAKISPAHPMGGLGDKAMTACPGKHAQAEATQRAFVAEFEALADERLNFLQTPIPQADGRKNENHCLYTEANEWGALYKNKCTYALNIAWEVGNRYGLGINAQRSTLAAQSTFRASPMKTTYMAALACYSPMLPIVRRKPHVNGRDPSSEARWSCERPSGS